MKSAILSLLALLVGLGAVSISPALAGQHPWPYSENAGGGAG